MKTRTRSKTTFVICIDNSDYPASLELHKVYAVLPDERAAEDDYLRVVDESGEDYLYSAQRFVPVELPARARRSVIRGVGESTIPANAPSYRMRRKLKSKLDPIIGELQKVRETIAKAHDYDVNEIAASIPGFREKTASEKRRPQAPKRTSRQRKAS